MTMQPIGYNTEAFTEEELTFLDDVPEVQVDEFLEWVTDTKVSKWFFSNSQRVMPFESERFTDVGDYFRYLRSLNAS